MEHNESGSHGVLEEESHEAPHEEGEGNWLVSYADMMTLLVGFFVILMSFSTVDQKKLEEVKKAAAQEFGGQYETPFGDLAGKIREELEALGLGREFTLKMDESGVTISFQGAVFFDSGMAEVKEAGVTLINRIIPVIQKESKDFDVLIEGHTDDNPIIGSKTFKNNWDLSSVRACRVLELFQNQGFSAKKLTAIGRAETEPVLPNRNAKGEPIVTNQAQNRRVVVKIKKPIERMIPVPAEGKEEAQRKVQPEVPTTSAPVQSGSA